MKIFLVDDHGVLIAGLRSLLRDELPEADVIGTAESGREALARLTESEVDLLITDHSMPGMDGLELIRRVRKSRPGLRVIVLSMYDELHLFRELEQEGIDGYVLKQDSNAELTTAIRTVMDGGHFVSPRLSAALQEQGEHASDERPLLTRRERQILKLIIKELSNQEIAEKLFISVLTVETHRKNIFRKTGAGSLVGLVNFAHANGLVDVPE